MEAKSNDEDNITNYYHQMGDSFTIIKNYKSDYIYYTKAAKKYLHASNRAKRPEIANSLKEKCELVIQKAEICKKHFEEAKSIERSALNVSDKVRVFHDLSLKEQNHIFNNIDIYKILAGAYTEAFARTKNIQYLHATFAANTEAAWAYILGSRATDDETKRLSWNLKGKIILKKTEKLKAEIHAQKKYDKWNWLAKFTPDERTVIDRSSIV